MRLSHLLRGTLDELFPSVARTAWDEAAATGWRVDPPETSCHRCGAPSGPGGVTPAGCAFCVGRALAWDRLIRIGVYREPLRDWITAMKFHREWSWAERFGRELAALASTVGADPRGAPTVVCPVPMFPLRRWRRGYNQAELIARAFARASGWPMAHLLRRWRYTRPQTRVAASERAANVRRSFAARRINLTGWTVWLIDDVKTTGATAGACARLLKAAGADRVCVAVAAVADPRAGGFKAT